MQIRPDRGEAEIPDTVSFGLEPDGSEQRSVGVVPMDQEMSTGTGGEILSQQRFGQALALDDSSLDIPAGCGTGASKGKIYQIDDLRIVGLTGGFEMHRPSLHRELICFGRAEIDYQGVIMRPALLTAMPISRISFATFTLFLTGCGGGSAATGSMFTQMPISVSLPVSTIVVSKNGPTVIVPIQIKSTSETALVAVTPLPTGVQEKYSYSDTNPSGTLAFSANSTTPAGTYTPIVTVMSANQTASTSFTLVIKAS